MKNLKTNELKTECYGGAKMKVQKFAKIENFGQLQESRRSHTMLCHTTTNFPLSLADAEHRNH